MRGEFRAAQAARLIGMDVRGLKRLCVQGFVTHRKVCGAVRITWWIPRSEVDRLLREGVPAPLPQGERARVPRKSQGLSFLRRK